MKSTVEFKDNDYDYNNPVSEFGGLYKHQFADMSYDFCVDELGLPDEVIVENATDGQNLVRVTAILENNKGYDLSDEEMETLLEKFESTYRK